MNIIFVKFAIRNLLKNKLNTAINVLGFSLGIAACLFIYLFVNYEQSFEDFQKDKERIFRITGGYHSAGNDSKQGFTWYPTAPAVKEEIPGVESFCRVTDSEAIKCYRDKQLYGLNELRFVDTNFFNFFNFSLLTGNPETALNSADKIVLSEKAANYIYGKENPLGKSILYNHKLFTVSAIAANPPTNTQFTFDALIPVEYIAQSDDYWKGWGGGITFLSYIKLEKGVSAKQVEDALPSLLEEKVNKYWKEQGGMTVTAGLQNIGDVHFSDGSMGYDVRSVRSKKSLYVVASISFLILLLAVINYILLYSAQILSKSKNTGVLKIYGAGKMRLFAQMFAEVIILSASSSLVGIGLLALGKNFLNTKLQTSVSIGNSWLSVIAFLILTILIVSAVVTLISSRKIIVSKSIDIVKNKKIGGAKNRQGNALVVFQFAAVTILVIAVSVVTRQNSFLLNHELGFNKENILTLSSEEEFYNNELDEFKQQLKGLGEIQSVSLSSQPIGTGITQNGYTIGDETQTTMINALYTDADFLKCFGVKLETGENFRGNKTLDENAILINETLAKRAGWDNPIDNTISREGDLKVIGVVEDFNFASLEHAVRPMLIMANPEWDGWGYSTVNIRYQTSNIQGLIKEIKQLWQERFPETPYEVSFLDDMLASNYKSLEAQQKIISFFSLLGMIIAVVGLFGLTVFITKKRIKEIGIRKVNGAKISEILAMLNKDFVKWVAIAFVISCPIAYYTMSKWLESFAYKTNLSWWIFALAGLLALGIALLTVSWQSWRAATRNPVEALRYE